MSVPLENGNQHMQKIQNQKYSFSRYQKAARTGLKNLRKLFVCNPLKKTIQNKKRKKEK